jgi:hypothetical protein
MACACLLNHKLRCGTTHPRWRHTAATPCRHAREAPPKRSHACVLCGASQAGLAGGAAAAMPSCVSHELRLNGAGAAVNLCLAGLVAAVRITSLLGMAMLRNTFVTSVARFTLLHSPGAMAPKNAQAFRAMLVIADENGNHLGARAQATVWLGLGFSSPPRGFRDLCAVARAGTVTGEPRRAFPAASCREKRQPTWVCTCPAFPLSRHWREARRAGSCSLASVWSGTATQEHLRSAARIPMGRAAPWPLHGHMSSCACKGRHFDTVRAVAAATQPLPACGRAGRVAGGAALRVALGAAGAGGRRRHDRRAHLCRAGRVADRRQAAPVLLHALRQGRRRRGPPPGSALVCVLAAL